MAEPTAAALALAINTMLTQTPCAEFNLVVDAVRDGTKQYIDGTNHRLECSKYAELGFKEISMTPPDAFEDGSPIGWADIASFKLRADKNCLTAVTVTKDGIESVDSNPACTTPYVANGSTPAASCVGPVRFIPVADFQGFDNNGNLIGNYVKGKKYTVRAGNTMLEGLCTQWQTEGKITVLTN